MGWILLAPSLLGQVRLHYEAFNEILYASASHRAWHEKYL